MIRPSRNQWIFIGLFLLYSLTFQILLARSIETEQHEQIWKLATGYGLLAFFSGLLLGGLDKARSYRGDIGFQYHLYTFLISVVVWLVVGLLGSTSYAAMGAGYWLGMGGWTLGLLVHFAVSRHSLKGIPKGQVFD